MNSISKKSQKSLNRLYLTAALLGFCLPLFAEATVKPPSMDAALAKVTPALVRIHVVTVEHAQGREIKYESSGSGVIITEAGHVVTNHHVAGNARRIQCTLASKEVVDADLVGSDPLTDIAVIKLRASKDRTFPYASFGNSDSLNVGDQVFALGSPLALSQSVTVGIVSNVDLTMPTLYWPFDKMIIEGEDVGALVKWIGHDAAIFPGNSGGPLINDRGEIIGINEISMGISAAIPGKLAKKVARSLIETGEVQRSWLGIEVQPLLRSMDTKEGVLVSGTMPDSPADKAGFQPGDIIRKVDDKPVSVRFPEQLPDYNRTIIDLPVGEKISVEIARGQKRKVIKVAPQVREYALSDEEELKQWGMVARDMTLLLSREMKRKSKKGVLVSSIRPGGPAGNARPPLQSDDVILSVAGRKIPDLSRLHEVTDSILSGKKNQREILVEYERGQEQLMTVIEIGLNGTDETGFEIRKAWLPVSMQVLTEDIARALGIEGRSGVRITHVFPGPAEKAGLKTGDIIVSLDGERLEISVAEDIEVLPALIRRYKIGSTVELGILRDGKEMTRKVKLPPTPKSRREMEKYRDRHFEFTAREIGFLDTVKERWEKGQAGVLVSAVDQGGWAALGRLAVGDLLLAVNGQDVKNVSVLAGIMKEIAEKKTEYVVFQVKRGIHTLFVEIEADWEDESDIKEG